MFPIRVPLSIHIGDEKFNVGRVDLDADGSLTTVIGDHLPNYMVTLVRNALVAHPAFIDGREERAVRAQAARYGTQLRMLEDQRLWSDYDRLRLSWAVFRTQFNDIPELKTPAMDAYWSGYGGIAYNLYWPAR